MIVYKTTNRIDGMSYIGKDTKNNPKYLGSGIYLKRAVKKDGRESFVKETIAWCDTEDKLNFLEKFYIKFHNTKSPNGYNFTDGGDGGDTISDHPERERIIEECRKRIGTKNPMFGKIGYWSGKKNSEQSERMKEKNPNYGKDMSGENNPNHGKRHPGLNAGENNPMFGKLAEESPRFGSHPIPWNKGKKDIYSEETLKKQSEARKKYWAEKRRDCVP